MAWRSFLLALSIAAFVFSISFGSSATGERRGRSTPTTLIEPLDQPDTLTVSDLKIRDTRARSVSLTGPVRLRASRGGDDLLVVDDGARERVFELDGNASLTDIVGSFAGEVKSVSDFAISDSRVWLVDLLGSALHVRERSTRRWRTIRHRDKPYRLIPDFATQRELVVMRIAKDRQFDVITEEGSINRSFDPILLDQHRHSLALDGFVAGTANSVLFAGKYFGILASYSRGGTLNWLADIAGEPDLPAVATEGDRTWLEHGPIAASDAIDADERYAYVLSRRIHGFGVRAFVDIYAMQDGSYLHSLQLPSGTKWSSIAVSDHYLHAASSSAVVRWPREVLLPGSVDSLLSAGHQTITFDTRMKE